MDEATRLIESGYRCTSNRHRMVSRLDRPDWREHMARDHTSGFRGDADRNLETGTTWVRTLGAGAADHYRRVLSKDTISLLPEDVYKAVKAGARGARDKYLEIIPQQADRTGEVA